MSPADSRAGAHSAATVAARGAVGTADRAEAAERVFITVSLLSIFAGGYFGLGVWSEGVPTISLGLAVDGRVPFAGVAVWTYATVYTAWSVPLFLVGSRQLFRRLAAAYLFVLLTSFAGFVLLPANTAALRETVAYAAGEGFTAWGLHLIYSLDPPTNCFPSLHVGLATVVAVLVARNGRAAAGLAALWWSAVCLSTLATRQHFFVDVVGGALVGGVAALAVFAGQGRAAGEQGWAGLARYALFHALFVAVLFSLYAIGG